MIRQEFIGKKAKVVDANNPDNIGIEGTVLDETKETLNIDGKLLLKKDIIFKINNITINGKKLTKRPEDRIKVKR